MNSADGPYRVFRYEDNAGQQLDEILFLPPPQQTEQSRVEIFFSSGTWWASMQS
jgi:hypothetical protein